MRYHRIILEKYSFRGTPHFDKTFFELLRRRMEQDRQRAKNASYNRPTGYGIINPYIAPFSIISFLIGFGILIRVLQGRYVRPLIDQKSIYLHLVYPV